MSLATTIKNAILDGLIKFQGITYAKVITYNESDYSCDVQPLKFHPSKGENGVEHIDYAKINNVPIVLMGSVKSPMVKDDIVIIANSVSTINTTSRKSSDLDGILAKDNCVIVGIVGSSSTPAIEITEDKIVFTSGTTTFTIDATGATVEVGGITVNLFTHMHPTAALGAPSPPTPGT